MSLWKLTTLVAVMVLSACGGSRGPSGTDLIVSGSGPAEPVLSGATAKFAMTVANAGSNSATDVKIVNSIGNQLALSGITCAADGGAVCPETPSVVMTIATLPPGGRLTFEVSATVTPSAGGTITNTMTATLNDDIDRTNNSATVQATAHSLDSNIIVGGAGPVATVAGGGPAEFVMTVRNDGPDDATTLHIVNTVGGNLSLTGVTCSASGGAVCPSTLGVSMDLDRMPVGGALAFGISTTVALGTSGTIANTMSATVDNDSTRTDNSSVVTATAYTARAGVSVAGVGPASAVPSGGSAAFKMTVSNAGPDAANAVRIINTVGGNLTLTAVSCSPGVTAVCPTTLGPAMDVPTLAVGASLTFYVSATVVPGTNGAITNTMTATPDSDLDRSDNTAVAIGTATANNVSVAGTAPTGPIAGGSSATFVMLVSNSGPSEALDVGINNVVSANLTLGAIACVGSGGAVCPASTGASMLAPSIPSNGSLSFNVATTVVAGANGTATNAMTVTGAGDSRSADNSASALVGVVSADLGVSQTGAATVSAGGSAVFTAVVANPGPGPANNLTITQTLNRGYGVTIECTASPGATCPAALAQVMTVGSLPAGRFLTLTYSVALPGADRGNVVSTVNVVGDGDPQPGNNTASVTTVAVDARNGAYKAYAADGRLYDLTIDFDAALYTMVGATQSVQRSFISDASGGGYTVGGNSRFRVVQDVLVGGHDFGSGVMPFVAARNFATSVSQLAGAFNLATRNVSSTGSGAVTHAGTARVSGNVLQVCQTDNFVEVTQQCGSDLRNYTLSVNGDVFTGLDATTGELYSFRMARTGAATLLLSATTAPDGTQQFRIGLPESSGLSGGLLNGSSTAGDWLSIAMSLSTYSFAGATASNTLSLQLISAQGPFAMLQNANPSFLAEFYVLQASPLAVMIGAFGGASSGLLQVSLP